MKLDNIRLAIQNKKVISFVYNNERRLVEPFCCGLNHKLNQVLRGYQIKGYSQSLEVNPWRLYLLDKIYNLEITDKYFDGDRSGYNPNDSDIIKIYSCI